MTQRQLCRTRKHLSVTRNDQVVEWVTTAKCQRLTISKCLRPWYRWYLHIGKPLELNGDSIRWTIKDNHTKKSHKVSKSRNVSSHDAWKVHIPFRGEQSWLVDSIAVSVFLDWFSLNQNQKQIQIAIWWWDEHLVLVYWLIYWCIGWRIGVVCEHSIER